MTRIAQVLIFLWLAACCVAGVLRDRNIVEDLYQDDVSAVVALAAEQMERLEAELGKLRIYPLMLANQSDIQEALEQFAAEDSSPDLSDHPDILASPELARLNDFLKSLARELRVSSIFVVTTDGYTLSTSRDRGADISDATSLDFREYIEEALTGTPGDQFIVSSATGTPGFVFSYPVRLQDEGAVAGVVAVRVDGESFADHFAYEPDITYITDNNGVVMLATRQDFFLKVLSNSEINKLGPTSRKENYAQQKFKELPITQHGRVGGSGTRVDVAADGGLLPYMLASKVNPETGWQVNVLHRISGLTQARQSKALGLFFVFTLGLIVIFAVERLLIYVLEMRERSRRDPLTNLYNRYHMEDQIGALLALHDRGNLESVTALMLDIDHFKSINDTYGHAIGDMALRCVAKIFLREARLSDIVYRTGGEEFLFFMVGQSRAEVAKAATRVRKKIETMRNIKPIPEFGITVSGGLAMHHKGESLEQLLIRADALLYKAKNQGRNRIELEQVDQSAAN